MSMYKIGVTPYIVMSRAEEARYSLEVWRQPLRHWLTARLYQLYDAIMWHYLPPVRIAQQWWDRHSRNEWPLCARRDERLFMLDRKHREVIFRHNDVDKDVWNKLTGRRHPNG